jgi:hypothetical protein
MFRKHASAVRGWLHWPTHAFRRGTVALIRVAVVGVVAVTTAWTSARAAAPVAASGPTSTAPTGRHHYHLYPGDVVDVDGSPRFFWSCSYYWVGGPQQRSYRLFRCARTDSGMPGANGQPRLRPLNVVVSRDNVFVQRGHKTLYVAWR